MHCRAAWDSFIEGSIYAADMVGDLCGTSINFWMYTSAFDSASPSRHQHFAAQCKKHMVTHTSEKPCTCVIYGNEFSLERVKKDACASVVRTSKDINSPK